MFEIDNVLVIQNFVYFKLIILDTISWQNSFFFFFFFLFLSTFSLACLIHFPSRRILLRLLLLIILAYFPLVDALW